MNDEFITQPILRLLNQIAPDSETEKLNPVDDIRHKLEFNSFDILQFLLAKDVHFGIETPEEGYGKITTL